jgi:ribosomal protein S18 acetylase RimI-like enzyme
MIAVERMTPGLLDRATLTVARAFEDDPMFAWVFPDPQHRPRSLQVLNRVPLRYAMRYGHVAHSHDAKAVAIWIPPGQAVSIGGMARFGLLTVPFRIGFRAFGTFAGANDVMGKIHKTRVPEPHWYLLIVAVDPELQGHGAGTALLKEGLARADQSNQPCYLETSNERNVPFYERFGFKVITKVPLGPGGPPGWAMHRSPRVSA